MERLVVAEPRTVLGAIEQGAWTGALVAPIVSAPAALLYLARFHATEPLPWLALIPQFATFVALTGASYAATIAGGVALARRALSRIVLGALGGALGGVAPGAFAAWHFGRMDAPWFGGHGIAIAAALAAVVMGTALVRVVVPALSPLRAWLFALAPLPIFAPIIGVAISLGARELDYDALRLLVLQLGVLGCGAVTGALVGALLGAWIGTSAALASRA
ncbi:hypothetical protein [Sandaracinus amylolyticus]|uniref:Uncharacterized protein n=1 Tax=Sandaracinus amylolyticus TaxID=927083 RepID=A0A0F6YL51_9BACT|nr:hypothetical protein [Sandaracinus amylolyticus]AKF07910.1 hypothetical protein DB32_005059 [Sandaracinus amylolyticus]